MGGKSSILQGVSLARMEDSSGLHPAVRGLKTVCRCNNIKYKTIERVIRDGAKSVAEVARRTGATTGYCGGSCTPDIQQMIAEIAPPEQPAKPPAANAAPAASEWWVRKP